MKTPDEIKKAVSLCILCGRCADCPYCLTGCMSALNADVLAYIEQLESRVEQKNRVLTLEEVAQSEVMWYENRRRKGALVVILGCGHCEPDFTKLIDRYGCKFYWKNAAYNNFWRCWLRKPTEAERRGTLWVGDSRE